MSTTGFPYRIFPLGDSAITIDFGNCIDDTINEHVIQQFNKIRQAPFPGFTEAVPSYSSLTLYYDPVFLRKAIPASTSVYEWIKSKAAELLDDLTAIESPAARYFKIPVCHDTNWAKDLPALAAAKHLDIEEVVHIHTSAIYKVYMMGFLPGFPYMGEVDKRIEMPRKTQPHNILSGSVGIAGRQTGIYPMTSPGGWQIIGRTPLKLFDSSKEDSSLLKTGDRVEFYSITKEEFDTIKETEEKNKE